MRTAQAALGRVYLFVKDLNRSAAFYSEGVGLKVVSQSDHLAELADQGGLRLCLAQSNSRAELCRGYSPILEFRVKSIAEAVERLAKYNSELQGEVLRGQGYSVQAVVGPQGQMVSLAEFSPLPAEGSQPAAGRNALGGQQLQSLLRRIRF